MDTRTFEQIAVDKTVAELAEWEARRAAGPPPPTPEQQLAQSRFREQITEHALLHGVRPQSVRFVVRDAEEIFELRDGALVARNGATDPSDPLSPLSPARWLADLAKTDSYLFAAQPGRAH